MSSVDTDIHDSLLVLQSIENECELTASQRDRIKAIKTELWFLKTFLDWKRKQNRKKLMALQKHIKPLMKSIGDDLRNLCESTWHRKDEPDQLDTITSDVLQKIRFSKPDIRGYYSYPEIPSASPLTHELVVEFINNVVRNLWDLLIARLGELLAVPDDSETIYFQVKDQMKLVAYELTVLKKFVCFLGTIYSPELKSCWKAFLSHAEVVATNTATVCFFYLPDSNEDKSVALEIANSLIDLLQKRIEPTEPRVRDIYADVLLNIRLSGSRTMLLTTLFSLAKDQTETLPDQLKSSRIILNELSLINSIQDEMRNRFFTRLENVAVNAGLVVYSLYDSSKDKEHQNQELIVLADTVQLVKTQVNRDIREWVRSHLPKNDSLGSINFLLDSLKALICFPADSLASVKNQLELVHEELEFLQPLLKGAAEQSNNKYDEIQDIAARVIDNAHELEDTIDSLEVRDIPLSYLKIWLSVMTEKIKIVKTELPKPEKKEITIVSPATNDEEPVGFKDVKETIRGQLVGGPRQLDIISIVGMPGLGKTTLARSFMNDQSIVSHFNFRGECRVSQVYTRKDLLLSILSDATHEPIDLSKEGESELASRLKQTLMRRRYLLIIDDVWEKDAWDDLRLCFPDDDNGSRIILTTRLWEVSLYAARYTDPHDLRLFNNDESWSLLQRKVFGEENCPEELKQVGQEIAKKCKGLPLSVVLVAGLLARMGKEEQCWKQMEASLGAQIQDGTKDLVQLSYYNLPNKLKSCLLYFGAFLEDREILVSKLTRLWIAEDFIEDDDDKDLEDIAEDYFEDLIRRNLVIVTKKRSIGKIKACRVHDLVLDFCKEKAVEENFLLWLKRDDDDDPPRFYSKKAKQQGLSSNSDRDRIARWSASCSYARSILFREVSENRFSVMKNASGLFGSFKFLRVLDLEFVVVDSFPTELRNLRYFAVRTAKNSIPSSVNNLRNLETFQVKGMKAAVSLPETFWKLDQLRHVHIDIAMFENAMKFLDKGPSKLENLATLSSPYISSAEDMERIVSKTPNLRKLRCIFDKSWGRGKNGSRFPVLDSLQQLETLKVLFFSIPKMIPTGLNFPLSLKKLSLCNFPLELAGILTIAQLPSLYVLKLQQVDFERNEWEVRDDEFPQLKFLKLENLNLSKWRASDEAFSPLERLVLHRCSYLREIPSRFGDMDYLQHIEVKSCNQSVVDSAMEIRETQVEMLQRCGFKVFIQQ